MDKDSGSTPVVGASSLLVVFTVLCLTVFALLSLATAQADARISDASAKAVTDYYAADTAAEELLARLRAGEAVPGVVTADDENGTLCVYSVPMDEGQTLSVDVLVNGGEYKVLRWQVESVGEWSPDTSLPVWDGE